MCRERLCVLFPDRPVTQKIDENQPDSAKSSTVSAPVRGNTREGATVRPEKRKNEARHCKF